MNFRQQYCSPYENNMTIKQNRNPDIRNNVNKRKTCSWFYKISASWWKESAIKKVLHLFCIPKKDFTFSNNSDIQKIEYPNNYFKNRLKRKRKLNNLCLYDIDWMNEWILFLFFLGTLPLRAKGRYSASSATRLENEFCYCSKNTGQLSNYKTWC